MLPALPALQGLRDCSAARSAAAPHGSRCGEAKGSFQPAPCWLAPHGWARRGGSCHFGWISQAVPLERVCAVSICPRPCWPSLLLLALETGSSQGIAMQRAKCHNITTWLLIS